VPQSQQLTREQDLDATHPWLALIRNDNERLNTRLRWEKERWKPRLDLQYNFLADNGMSLTEQQFLNENYQVGIKLQYPLLIRNARARTAQVKAGIWQNELAFSEERNRLQNVIAALQFNLQNIREQVAMGTIITQNSLQLYQAELTRFRLGESSVFLVNTREIQYLQAQNALIDLRTEEVLTGYSLLHEMGVLFRVAEF
jgi:outer membrane protein TolC